MKEHRYDYVIAGAGTAGCLLANRLSADPDVKVLLIEAGGKDDWIWIKIPVGYLFCINNPRTDWCYRTEPDPGLNGRSIIYARGKVLGGCSSINAMIYMRGQARDYDEWAALTGDSTWRWDSVLPIFRRSEDYFRGADEAHGAGGEWRVEPQRLRWDILDAYREAMVQAGIPRIDDFNRGDNTNLGSNWSNRLGGDTAYGISTNRASIGLNQDSASFWNAATFTANQYAEVKLSSLPAPVPSKGVWIYLMDGFECVSSAMRPATSSMVSGEE